MIISLKKYKPTTTHMNTLIKAVQATDGPVLELGSGFFSTPLLHWLCAENSRKLVSYEDDMEYFEYLKQFKSRNHRTRFVEDWDKIDIEKHWSVVLIDHRADRRAIDAIRLKNFADYIVIHDSQTETESAYRYDKVWPHFRNIYHWKIAIPWTSVVSNSKNMEIFK